MASRGRRDTGAHGHMGTRAASEATGTRQTGESTQGDVGTAWGGGGGASRKWRLRATTAQGHGVWQGCLGTRGIRERSGSSTCEGGWRELHGGSGGHGKTPSLGRAVGEKVGEKESRGAGSAQCGGGGGAEVSQAKV